MEKQKIIRVLNDFDSPKITFKPTADGKKKLDSFNVETTKKLRGPKAIAEGFKKYLGSAKGHSINYEGVIYDGREIIARVLLRNDQVIIRDKDENQTVWTEADEKQAEDKKAKYLETIRPFVAEINALSHQFVRGVLEDVFQAASTRDLLKVKVGKKYSYRGDIVTSVDAAILRLYEKNTLEAVVTDIEDDNNDSRVSSFNYDITLFVPDVASVKFSLESSLNPLLSLRFEIGGGTGIHSEAMVRTLADLLVSFRNRSPLTRIKELHELIATTKKEIGYKESN